MREYFEAVKGVRPDEPLSADVRRHAAEVLGAPASTLGEIGAELASLAAATVPGFDDQMSICYWWQVNAACATRRLSLFVDIAASGSTECSRMCTLLSAN